MMSPADIRASYARALVRAGEAVTLQRDDLEHACRARVVGYDPDEIVGDIEQGDRKVILLADALPVTPKRGDYLIVRGTSLHIEAVDDNTRRVEGELIAYEIQVRG